jgi:hypothetical protein
MKYWLADIYCHHETTIAGKILITSVATETATVVANIGADLPHPVVPNIMTKTDVAFPMYFWEIRTTIWHFGLRANANYYFQGLYYSVGLFITVPTGAMPIRNGRSIIPLLRR